MVWKNKEIPQSVLSDALKGQLQRRIHNVDPEDNFLDSICGVFCIEKGQSDQNKNKYFGAETAILILNGLVTLISAISSGSNWDVKVISALGMITAVLSGSTTILIGLKGLRQWRETWLRHRNCLNLFYLECYQYAYCVGIYAEYNAKQNAIKLEEAEEYERQMLHKFKTAVITILSENNLEFMANMKRNDKEQV